MPVAASRSGQVVRFEQAELARRLLEMLGLSRLTLIRKSIESLVLPRVDGSQLSGLATRRVVDVGRSTHRICGFVGSRCRTSINRALGHGVVRNFREVGMRSCSDCSPPVFPCVAEGTASAVSDKLFTGALRVEFFSAPKRSRSCWVTVFKSWTPPCPKVPDMVRIQHSRAVHVRDADMLLHSGERDLFMAVCKSSRVGVSGFGSTRESSSQIDRLAVEQARRKARKEKTLRAVVAWRVCKRCLRSLCSRIAL